MRSDVKQSASIFRRNVRHIRNWLEEESATAAKYGLQPLIHFYLSFNIFFVPIQYEWF